MRTYILTHAEKRIIQMYLDREVTSNQTRNLKLRAKGSLRELAAEIALIKKFLAAAGVA